jgi:hypothetical protein
MKMPYKDKEKRKQYQKLYGKTHHRNPQQRHEYNVTNRKHHAIWMRNYRKNPEIKKKEKLLHEKYYEKNKELLNSHRRETTLFYRSGIPRLGRILMLFELGGCCVFTFETNPFKLQIHHPFGRKEHPEIMVQLCRHCHRKLHWILKRKRETGQSVARSLSDLVFTNTEQIYGEI